MRATVGDRVSFFFPGSDATVQHLGHAHRRQIDAA
jgi:hypothetical protein